ncbi:hypothetical protein [Rhizobium sp. BK176]|uniref:hypothetical protein n=1 Tax=Rhizobium sp. BK176 TaxID=2587071 RepID=UPI0021691C2A|nr:hypothetical protein [Rhizobium sp. BK176]MCS4088640.1 hypothetical protein [Rhizobium sp. BK176]
MNTVLKSQTVHINPTERLDIARDELKYTVRGEGTRTYFEVRLTGWNLLKPKLRPGLTVSLDFQLIGKPKWTLVVGDVQSGPINTFGVIRGYTEGGFDPSHLSAVINISDPKQGHRIVAGGSMHKPDIDETEADESPEESIKALRSQNGKARGLIDIISSEDTAGSWDLTLHGVATPVLRVHPTFGKALLLNNREVQLSVLPEVFRRIVTELAACPEDYDSEPWAAKFKEFAAAYAATGEWDYFTSAGKEDRTGTEEFVSDGVKNYYRFLCTKRAQATQHQSMTTEE